MNKLRLFVRPNVKARKIGLKTELEFGWIIGKDHYSKWGSCKNDAAFQKVVKDIERLHGKIEIVDLRRAVD